MEIEFTLVVVLNKLSSYHTHIYMYNLMTT